MFEIDRFAAFSKTYEQLIRVETGTGKLVSLWGGSNEFEMELENWKTHKWRLALENWEIYDWKLNE